MKTNRIFFSTFSSVFLYIFSILFFLFSFTKISFALQITEIMYDPAGSDTGNEWIELYNDTSTNINLTTHKFFENNVNHGITASQGGNILNAGEYAVLADNPANFLSQHSGYAGKIFDSAFSLSNSGEYLEMRDSANANLFSVTYISNASADGTGGTLNYVTGATSSWQAFIESPGIASPQSIVQNTLGGNASSTATSTNASSTNNNSSTTNTTTNTASSYSYGYTSRTYTLGDLNMLTPREIWTVAGANTYFFVKPIDSKKNTVPTNTYWSYGDGAEGYGATTTHKYYNAGYYTAFVESEISNAYGIERIKVNVANPDISISEVGDNYIVIKNNISQELNIGGFIIGSDQGFFKLSRQLILKENSDIKIDGRIFGFSNLTNVKILASDMSNITTYKIQKVESKENNNLLKNLENTPSISFKKIGEEKKENKKTFTTKIIKNNTATTSKNNIFDKDLNNLNKNTNNLSKSILDKTKKEESFAKTVDTDPIKKEKNWLYWLYE